MTKHQAATAYGHLMDRPAYVAQQYLARGFSDNSEVTSGSLFFDLAELAGANTKEMNEGATERNRVLASAYGYDDVDQTKPFIFTDGFAIIPIHGLLINRFSWSWGFVTGYNFIRAQVAAALADTDVKAIIYDINSQGGTVSGCSETADAIFAANKANGGKPSIAVIDAGCFSAAYFCGSQADHMVLTPSGMTGSIGALRVHFDYSRAANMAGVDITFIFAGEHKVDGNPYVKLTDEVIAEMQADINEAYDTFVAAVVRGRPQLSDEDVRGTEARCYSAADALSLGLVDAVQNPSAALEAYNELFPDTDDVDETDSPEIEERDMTVATTAAAKTVATAPAAVAQAPAVVAVAAPEAVAAAPQPDAAAIRNAERTRMSGIMNHPEALGRTALANHLATETNMTVEEAGAVLAVAEKKAGTPAADTGAAPAGQAVAAAAAAAAPASNFTAAMNNSRHPGIGPAAVTDGATGSTAEQTPASRVLGLLSASTGRKVVAAA